jgi:hypothetical protein
MRYVLVAVAMVTIGAGIMAQTQVRRDGDWEIKVEMQMPGMPMNMPARRSGSASRQRTRPTLRKPYRPPGAAARTTAKSATRKRKATK